MDHTYFMKEAIKEAERGIKKGQTPFGAVIVNKKTGKIIAKAHNTVIKDNDPSAHAEINAIRKASKKMKSIHLSDCIIYSTCEPCPMCFSAIHWAGIKEIYFGANISDAKALGFREMEIPNKTMNCLIGNEIKIKQICKKEANKMMQKWKGNPY